MKGPTKQSKRHIESVLAALDVLDCFLTAPSLSTKQLIELTGFTRNRVMRLTGTLLHKGYLVQDSSAGTFSPGPKTLSLGNVFERNHNLVTLAKPVLRELSLRTGESVSLYIREGLERVVAARQEGSHVVRYTVTVGQRMDLHAGAGGKVLLAYAPKEVLDAIISGLATAKRTDQTITNPKKLLKELDDIRRRGYSISMGERVPDACAIAAPVFDGGNRLLCSMAVIGPVSRFTSKKRQSYQNHILEAARNLSRQLGWKG